MFTAPRVPLNGTSRNIPNGDGGAFATVAVMRRYVQTFRASPTIRAAALSITQTTPERDQNAEVEALFSFVRDHVRYVRDVRDVETLATPVKTLQLMAGDCDDQSTLLAALLESVGYPTRFVIAAYNGARNFAHVYVQTLTRDGWISLDPTEDRPMGWSAPYPSRIWYERN